MNDSATTLRDNGLGRRLDHVTGLALGLFALTTTLSLVFQDVFFLALAAWLYRRLWVQKRSLSFPAWGWVWIAFMAWGLLASLNGANEWNSLWNWRKWILAVAAWCVADAVEDGARLNALLGALLVGAAAVNLGASLIYGSRPVLAWLSGESWAVVTRHWVLDYGVAWRARGGSGGYMVLAACDALLLLFFTGLSLEDPAWRRPWVYGALASIALGLLLTMTRGAWLASGLVLGLLLLFRRPLWGLLLVLVLGATVLAAPDSVFVRRFKTLGDPNNGSDRERVYMAQVGFAIMRDHPWLGVGDSLYSFDRKGPDGTTEHVTGYFLRYLTPEAVAWYKVNLPGHENGHLHDVPLQLGAMYGLPGLGLAVLFFGGLIAWSLRRWRKGLTPLARGVGLGTAAGLLAFFAHGMTEYNLGAFQTAFTLWFVVGLSLAAARLDRAQGSRGDNSKCGSMA